MNASVRSAARVLDLLEILAGEDQGASLASASDRLAAPKSSTLMLLRTLTGRGYVQRGEDDRYRLNPAFRASGFGWGGMDGRLVAVATPVLQHLAHAIGETAILGTLTDKGMVRLLAKAVTHEAVRYDIEVGQELPAYCTAIGRVLLGQLDSARRRELLDAVPILPVTSYCETDRIRIEQLIELAGRSGISVVAEEYALGGTGAAVPIKLADGQVAGAVNAGCISPRFADKHQLIEAALNEAAEEIAARLSNRGEA